MDGFQPPPDVVIAIALSQLRSLAQTLDRTEVQAAVAASPEFVQRLSDLGRVADRARADLDIALTYYTQNYAAQSVLERLAPAQKQSNIENDQHTAVDSSLSPKMPRRRRNKDDCRIKLNAEGGKNINERSAIDLEGEKDVYEDSPIASLFCQNLGGGPTHMVVNSMRRTIIKNDLFHGEVSLSNRHFQLHLFLLRHRRLMFWSLGARPFC